MVEKSGRYVTMCALCLVAAGMSVMSATTVSPTNVQWDWSGNATQGTTVTNALDWFAVSNWKEGSPVNSGLYRAAFTNNAPNAVRYVHADREVNVADITATSDIAFTTNSTRRLVFISDHDFLLNRDASITETPAPNGIVFYSDVSWIKGIYPKSLIFCGDVATAAGAATSLPFAFGNPLEFRCDLYAKSADPVRTQAMGFKSTTMNAGDLTLVAPHGSSEDVTGTWDQKAGSKYLFRVGDAHVLCAGTLVSGTGIPEGAFVRRIFSDNVIELSEAATETLAANALTFAAFSPRMTQEFYIYSNQGGASHRLNFMKWRPEDDFRVTLTYIQCIAPTITYIFDVKEKAVPATTVIAKENGTAGKFSFANCRVEFGIVGKNNNLTFTNAANYVENASSVATLVVSNGLAATLNNFTKQAGTLVKEGAGALTLGFTGTEEAYSGTTVVKEGVLTLTGIGDSEAVVKNLAISNGATLHVPEAGIRCENLYVQPDAIVSGPGELRVSTMSEDILHVTCIDGARVVFVDVAQKGEIFITPPATNVPGTPALWFDASKLNTFTYETVEGTERISRWNDVRGAEYMFATNTCETRKPELQHASDDCFNSVYFEKVSSTGNTSESYELGWSRNVQGICSVFKVVGCRMGGGQFLGECKLFRNAEYGTFSNPVFCDSAATVKTLLAGASFRINGEERDWLTGYAYQGSVATLRPEARIPQVVELHLADGVTVSASGFSSQTDSAKGRNGNQELYELIVYTNALTQAERIAIRGYLMQKWIKSEANYDRIAAAETREVLSAGETLGVAEGTKMAAETISGEGLVTKTGEGLLYVADCCADTTALKVEAGEVKIRSVALTKAGLPSGAALHLDAADADSYQVKRVADETTYVTTWGDTRGSNYGAAIVEGGSSGINPKVVPNKLNGLPMIDFGTSNYQKDNCMTTRVMTVRTFFTVQNSADGGGFIFGDIAHNCYYAKNSDEWGYFGLMRYPDGALKDSIIWVNYNNTVSWFGAGATHVWLNGTNVVGTSAHYSGGNDLLAIQCYEGLRGNSISHSYCNDSTHYGAGKMVGELLYYENRLSNDDTKYVEAYLAKKWFNRETSEYRQAELAALDVAEGATVTIVGGAPLKVSSFGGKGTVAGALQLDEGAAWRVNVGADGVSSALQVTGALDISSAAKIVLVGTGKAPVGSYTIATAASITGNVPAIDATGASSKLRYRVRKVGNTLVLDVNPIGLAVIIR